MIFVFNRKNSLLIIIFLGHLTSVGQNLIINPSFEDTVVNLPYKIFSKNTFIRCIGWSELNSADYFWYGNTNEFRRKEALSRLNAHSGECFAGFAIKTYESSIYFREYIIANTKQPLREGCSYKIQLYANSTNKNKYRLSEIDILFSNFLFKPDSSLESRIITLRGTQKEKTEWTLYEGEYKASGNEQFVTIGYLKNILKYEKNKNQEKKANKYVIYTFIDDVTITPLLNNDNPQIDSVSPQTSLNVKSIFFDLNKSKLDSSYFPYLDSLFNYLVLNPSVGINIYGYTDTVGQSDYNFALSLRRAKVVAEFFTDKKIEESRIKFYGRGVYFDINSDSKQQRKVEIEIYKMSENPDAQHKIQEQ